MNKKTKILIAFSILIAVTVAIVIFLVGKMNENNNSNSNQADQQEGVENETISESEEVEIEGNSVSALEGKIKFFYNLRQGNNSSGEALYTRYSQVYGQEPVLIEKDSKMYPLSNNGTTKQVVNNIELTVSDTGVLYDTGTMIKDITLKNTITGKESKIEGDFKFCADPRLSNTGKYIYFNCGTSVIRLLDTYSTETSQRIFNSNRVFYGKYLFDPTDEYVYFAKADITPNEEISSNIINRTWETGQAVSVVRVNLANPTKEEYLVKATETEDYGPCNYFKLVDNKVQFCSITTLAEERWSDSNNYKFTFYEMNLDGSEVKEIEMPFVAKLPELNEFIQAKSFKARYTNINGFLESSIHIKEEIYILRLTSQEDKEFFAFVDLKDIENTFSVIAEGYLSSFELLD